MPAIALLFEEEHGPAPTHGHAFSIGDTFERYLQDSRHNIARRLYPRLLPCQPVRMRSVPSQSP